LSMVESVMIDLMKIDDGRDETDPILSVPFVEGDTFMHIYIYGYIVDILPIAIEGDI
jgi:hypothetical protein